MPALDINTIRKIGDPVHSNKWTFELIRVPEAVSSSSSVVPGDILDPQVVSLDLPRIQVSTIEVVHRGVSVNVPSHVDFDKQIAVTFIETSSKKIIKFFESWRSMVSKISIPVGYTPTGNINTLKGSFKVTMLNRQLEPLFSVFFEGVFVVSLDLGQAIGDKGADIVRPTITFSYDYFYFDKVF
jgi:hypothetical protein